MPEWTLCADLPVYAAPALDAKPGTVRTRAVGQPGTIPAAIY